jgi:hypothetical protein
MDFCSTVEYHFSGLIETASRPDVQKIRMTGFFFGKRLHWQFKYLLLLFTVCTYATCPYPAPDQSSPGLFIPIIEDPF